MLTGALAWPPATKTELFRQLRNDARLSAQRLNTFRDMYASDETQQLLAKARQSYSQDSDLTKANDVPAYGWDKS